MPLPRLSSSIAVALCALGCAASTADAGWKNLGSATAPGAAAKAAPGTVLRRAERAFAKKAAPAARRDLSPLLRRLALDLPRLKGAEKTRASRLLARPSDGNTDPSQNGWSAPEASNSPFCSAHFCVHWVDSSSDAPPLADGNGNGIPDWVETVSETAEHVYSVENSTLGWRAPRGDGSVGGGPAPNLTDIYLEDVGGSSIYGYAAPDPQPQRNSLFAYLVLDNDFSTSQFPAYSSPVDPLDVTLAHEYNHVLQFAYDASEETWMLESTAVWMEGKVYEPVHDYLQYIPGWTARPDQPITTFNSNSSDDPNNVKVYGSAVWNKWLDQRYGQDVVRNAWEDSVSAASFAPRAYDTAIRQHGGGGFSSEFSQFAAATAEWQAQNSGFPDGGLYPDVSRAGSLGVNATPGTIRLDHTTYAIVDIPLSSAPRIRLAMAAPSGTSAAVALVGLTGGSPGGTLVRTERIMPNGGKGTITFDNPGNLSRLSAVLVNADVKNGGRDDLGDYSFKRDNQLYYAHASTDFKAPTVKGGTATRHKLAVTFSEKVLGVSSKSLKISGVSAKLKFTPGSKKATLTPRAAFKSGRRYTVKFTSAITDLTLNKLKAITLTFKAP